MFPHLSPQLSQFPQPGIINIMTRFYSTGPTGCTKKPVSLIKTRLCNTGLSLIKTRLCTTGYTKKHVSLIKTRLCTTGCPKNR